MFRKILFICLSAILFCQCSNERDNNENNKENAARWERHEDSIRLIKYILFSDTITEYEISTKREFPFLDSARVRFLRTRDTRHLDSIQKFLDLGENHKVSNSGMLLSDIGRTLLFLSEIDVKTVVEYMIKNPNTKFRQQLIQNWKTYEEETPIKKFIFNILKLGKKQGLTPQETAYLIKMLDELESTHSAQ